MQIRRLEDPKSIEDACALLYEVYHEEVVWQFSPDNPSQLRIEARNNRNVLVDRFTDKAIWFGAFDDSKIVGCARLTFVDENNKLEMEGYKNSWIIQRYLPADKSDCAELTRAAVLKSHRDCGVIRHLFLAIFQYCEENQYSVCATPNHGYIVRLLKEIGWPLKMELAFKYEEHDPSPVNFNFANYTKSEVRNVILNLISYKISINPNNARILDALEIVAPILPTPVYWHDTKGVVLGINTRCLKAIGATRDIVGKTPYEFYPKEVAEHVLIHNKRVMETGEILSQDEPMKDILTGETKIFRSTKAPLYNDEGKIIGIIGSSIEVTKERQAEALKAEFIENMQHDIRTPISGIFSLLNNANKTGNMDELKKYLPYAVEAARELLDLHNEVIDFDNIEYGSKPIYERKFSLLELMHSAINLNSVAVLVHESTLELQVDDNLPDIIKGDDYRLKKILINLIGNAIKFTERGKIKVKVSLITQEKKEVTVRFTVEDTGIGMEESKLQTIFEKFTRLNPSNKGKFKGSGLGLHIVKKFADEIGAELDVSSRVNEGTVFTVDVCFELPIVQQLAGEKEHRDLSRSILIKTDFTEQTESGRPKSTVAVQVTSNKKETDQDIINICVIEDDMLAMVAAQNILNNLSYPCYIEKATCVLEALNLLRSKAFDIIISDLGLPDGTGFDIVEQIKIDKDHLNYETPFVALTAHSDDTRKERAKQAGFLALYNKPLSEKIAEKILTEYVLNENIVVDLTMISKILGGNEAVALEMVHMLIISFEKEKLLFEDAFNSNNYTKVRELFHKFRGGLSYVRVPEVDNLATMLHEEIKVLEREGKPLTKVSDKLLALFKAVDDVNNWLERYKAKHRKKR